MRSFIAFKQTNVYVVVKVSLNGLASSYVNKGKIPIEKKKKLKERSVSISRKVLSVIAVWKMIKIKPHQSE